VRYESLGNIIDATRQSDRAGTGLYALVRMSTLTRLEHA